MWTLKERYVFLNEYNKKLLVYEDIVSVSGNYEDIISSKRRIRKLWMKT